MIVHLRKHNFLLLYFSLFCLLNLAFYVIIFFFHSALPFQKEAYSRSYHIYLPDPRASNGSYSFLRSLMVSDAQWYIKIAEKGYPQQPTDININDKRIMDGLSYAYFPLYPLLLSIFARFIPSTELAAFILSNVFLILNFFSLYYVLSRWYSTSTAFKTIFLIFFFPFSIFYRSYFTEGLLLFLLIWFSYFLIQKKYLLSGVTLSLLFVTKGNTLFLCILFAWYLFQEARKKKLSSFKALLLFLLQFMPLSIWTFYNYLLTNDPFFFLKVREAWTPQGLLLVFYGTVIKILSFPSLPLHSFDRSQLEIFSIVSTCILLILSRKVLSKQLWWMCFLLWITPVFLTNTVSFLRYQTTSYPLFLFIALKLPNKIYYPLLCLFILGLYTLSLYFVNWYWIG